MIVVSMRFDVVMNRCILEDRHGIAKVLYYVESSFGLQGADDFTGHKTTRYIT